MYQQQPASLDSVRQCPHCRALSLERTRLPWYFRPLRVLRLKVRSYTCVECWRRPVFFGASEERLLLSRGPKG